MSGYQNLLIWQKARELATLTYQVSAKLPSKEQYGLTSQINRCAVSVPSNIAEGWSRNSTKEFINFLYISRGSLSELETQVLIAKDLGYFLDKDLELLQKMIIGLSKLLVASISKLKAKQVYKINP